MFGFSVRSASYCEKGRGLNTMAKIEPVTGSREALEALLDQTQIILESEAYMAFVERLDAPAQPNERLRKTL